MKVSVHLTFAGQCEAAFTFYQQHLGASIATMLKYKDSPLAATVPPEWREKIVHSSLLLGDNILAGADLLPAAYAPPKGFFVLLDIDDPAEAERIFHALSENGTIQMPLQTTFWAARFGVLCDQFGIPWEINCGLPA